MFFVNQKSKNMAKLNEQESPSINLIGNGTIIKGDIKSNGDIRIDGTVIGFIQSKGKVVIGPTGNIEGEIECVNGDSSGIIKAKVSCKELLSLKASSKLTGDIVTNRLAIEPGAVFSGTCNMGNTEQSFKNPILMTDKNEAAKTKESV